MRIGWDFGFCISIDLPTCFFTKHLYFFPINKARIRYYDITEHLGRFQPKHKFFILSLVSKTLSPTLKKNSKPHNVSAARYSMDTVTCQSGTVSYASWERFFFLVMRNTHCGLVHTVRDVLWGEERSTRCFHFLFLHAFLAIGNMRSRYESGEYMRLLPKLLLFFDQYSMIN